MTNDHHLALSILKEAIDGLKYTTAEREDIEQSLYLIRHRGTTYQPAPHPDFRGEHFDYLSYTQALIDITGSPWNRNTASSLADVRKKVGQDLVEPPRMPDFIFSRLEIEAAELRAELMKEKYEDLVVTLVCNVVYTGPNYITGGSLHIESLRHSQVVGRIAELRELCEGTVKVLMIYSEETNQMFWWNDLELDTKPRLPGYGTEYDKKRVGYRTTASGVL